MRAASAARGFIVGKVIAENKAGRLGSVLRGDVPGLLGRVGDGCVCRGGFGGALLSQAYRRRQGRPAVGSGSVPAGSALSAGSGSSGVLGTSGTVGVAASSRAGVSGGSGLLSDLGSPSSGAAGTGLSCAGALRSGVSSAEAFFAVLAAFGVLGFAVFAVFVFFLARGFLGTRQAFCALPVCGGRLQRCPSAQGACRRQTGAGCLAAPGLRLGGLLRLYRSGFLIFFHTHTHSFRDLYGCPAKHGSGTAGRVCRVQLFYSASRNCRPLFPSSAVCGSVDLLPMRSS